MRIWPVVVLLVIPAAPAQVPECPGPNDTAWSSSQSDCVGFPNTSCAPDSQSTCFYGFLFGGRYFGGIFDKKSGHFIIGHVGPFPDIQKGDQLRAIGAADAKRLTNVRTSQSLSRYTKERPARTLRLRLYRPRSGTWLTVTWRS
jgi:hypothetical protein